MQRVRNSERTRGQRFCVALCGRSHPKKSRDQLSMSATIRSVRPCCRPRVVVARASKLGRLVGVVAGGFAAVGPALAESTPRLENLTYDATNALSRASPDASDALSQLNAGDGDATPLIAGLAVGILVVGAGLKAITDEKGAVVKVRAHATSCAAVVCAASQTSRKRNAQLRRRAHTCAHMLQPQILQMVSALGRQALHVCRARRQQTH